jgi:3-dehydroquinate synthase
MKLKLCQSRYQFNALPSLARLPRLSYFYAVTRIPISRAKTSLLTGASLLSNLVIKSLIRDYDVFFSQSVCESLQVELQPNDVIFVDRKVFDYLNKEAQQLITANKHTFIDATEEQKSYTALTPIIEQLIENRFRRDNRLIAVGGGITQDMTAFIASMIYRGVEWIFFPTTLLAQADSCIGGKTSINIGKYKNQLGNFCPPSKIFIIPELVQSLPVQDFKSGMGEMLHFYLVSGKEDFTFYQERYEKAFTDNKILFELVRRNLEIKKGFIERDEFDRGKRLLLNYGHSFGHAIESITNYAIPHGIAVSYGMDMANFVSFKLGFIKDTLRKEIKAQLEKIWVGTYINNFSVEEFEKALSRDKKNIGNTYQLILTKGIGNMLKYEIEPNENFTNWIEEYFVNSLGN